MSSKIDTERIVQRAQELGFVLCGVAPANAFPELGRTEEWLELGYAREMKYLKDPRRSDPRAVMEGIRSVIVCALSYNTELPHTADALASAVDGGPRGWISRYAWGDDYHDIVLEKLEELLEALHQHSPEEF